MSEKRERNDVDVCEVIKFWAFSRHISSQLNRYFVEYRGDVDCSLRAIIEFMYNSAAMILKPLCDILTTPP